MKSVSIENRNTSFHLLAEQLPDKRKRVFEVIENLNKPTAQQIADHLNIPINQVTGRIKELRDLKLVIECGSLWNSLTHRYNTRYTTNETMFNHGA